MSLGDPVRAVQRVRFDVGRSVCVCACLSAFVRACDLGNPDVFFQPQLEHPWVVVAQSSVLESSQRTSAYRRFVIYSLLRLRGKRRQHVDLRIVAQPRSFDVVSAMSPVESLVMR